MCGLFGHTQASRFERELSRCALHTLIHRGPDQWGEWCDDQVYIGHRRLSILDLSERGRQPMTDARGDVVIAVNGEIYNYPGLKRELEPRYSFASHSDSEIVLHGYREWGFHGLLKRMDGMYAIALYDKTERKVYLARDRSGIKPLYYSRVNGGFAWASELKALTTWHGAGNLVDDVTALYDYLTYRYIPTPKTRYCDVFKLPPASQLVCDLTTGGIVVSSYWSLPVTTQPTTPEGAADRLLDLLDVSVVEQLMSDVPVGIFLSGGIDSSAVAASAVRRSPHIHTYSIGFAEKGYDESAFAEDVARHLGTAHAHRMCGPEDAALGQRNIPSWYDEPFADSSSVPTHLVSRFARDGITVALSGDGGDELFGGYRWYEAMHRRRPASRMLRSCAAPAVTRWGRSHRRDPFSRALRRLGYEKVWNEFEAYTVLLGGLLKQDKCAWAARWNIPADYDDYWYFRKYYRDDLPVRTRWQVVDFHTYLHDDIHTKVDRASMQVALEVRVPLLSQALIEFAFSLPEDIRYLGGRSKGIFRHALRDRLPQHILDRGKKGFGMPTREWGAAFSGDGRSWQENLLTRWPGLDGGAETTP
ncbi:MAG TPA: asparagine synthase (glutamine-hydrolyzing) [Kiritimatiellia bacterium]|nr:asparagine synthase (glutamine-hydrolyzing) [Kiritimatiellia bacterium]HMO98658.1 asparagine synthase (glutamine-hydrolyzing) [Kiritimatiellia bacterium]HMP90853.1 asparagine synthase (glutamine-hydrolyzing) [Kiritimatiellia bacterium]